MRREFDPVRRGRNRGGKRNRVGTGRRGVCRYVVALEKMKMRRRKKKKKKERSALGL